MDTGAKRGNWRGAQAGCPSKQGHPAVGDVFQQPLEANTHAQHFFWGQYPTSDFQLHRPAWMSSFICVSLQDRIPLMMIKGLSLFQTSVIVATKRLSSGVLHQGI